MAEELKRYELMVIFKPLLPDDVRKEAHKNIVELAERVGGEVKEADVWGKRYLAYKIDGHEEGYYIVYEMDLPSSEVNEVRKRLGNVGEVLRYMISRIDSAAEAKTKLNKKEIEI
jgi:small subunit ribosomal protein S6